MNISRVNGGILYIGVEDFLLNEAIIDL